MQALLLRARGQNGGDCAERCSWIELLLAIGGFAFTGPPWPALPVASDATIRSPLLGGLVSWSDPAARLRPGASPPRLAVRLL